MDMFTRKQLQACAYFSYLLDTYLEPDRSFLDLREMVKNNSIDILHDFTKACRDGFESLGTQQV
jgi:hypothetical protein